MRKQHLSKNSSLSSRFKKLALTGLSATILAAASMTTQAAIVTLGDGSEYEIYLDSHVGNTWTYYVSEISGKDLSHLNIGIPSCIEHITDHSPAQGYATSDGSTGFEGIKWDVEDGFTSGTFSFTLDADYPETGTTIEMLAKAGEPGNERTGNVVGPDCIPPPSCNPDYVYGVHDDGLNDSYFFKVNTSTLEIEALGSPCMGCDIEGLDISPSGKMFGSAGDDTDMPGAIYEIDMVTGTRTLKPSGPSGYEIDGISFNPITGELTGWAQDVGRLSINSGTGAVTPPPTLSTGEIEDLSWANNGTTIYFILNDYPEGVNPDASKDNTVGQKLMSYDSGVLTNVCDIAGEIEALEVLRDDGLMIGYHDKDDQLVQIVNPENCATSFTARISNSRYTDIEGLAVCLPPALTR